MKTRRHMVPSVSTIRHRCYRTSPALSSAGCSAAGVDGAGASYTSTVPGVCAPCGATRPAEHSYCFDCGRRLGAEVLAANGKRFKPSGLTMAYTRVLTKHDRRSGPPLRTWGDHVARLYFSVSLLLMATVYASRRGWLPSSLWDWAHTFVRSVSS